MKRRILSIITALALCLSLCPTWAFATQGEPDTGLCPHHQEHTGCGCIAPTEGQPCNHGHTAECYTLGYLPGDKPEPPEAPADGEVPEGTEAHELPENLLDCRHVHDELCGYVQADPGQLCGYVCRLCPIEDLIAALPWYVTEDSRTDVAARLQEILSLYKDLAESEQEMVDLSRCLTLQTQLDESNAAAPLAGTYDLRNQGSPNITSSNVGDYNNATITSGGVSITNKYIAVDNTTVTLTISDLNIDLDGDSDLNRPSIYLQNGANLTLNLRGTNSLRSGGSWAGINVEEGCTLTINGTDSDSLTVTSGAGGAGIGANYWTGSSAGQVKTVGTIVINGGNITAKGRNGGPGIGGTMSCSTGDVTINGGIVTAVGSEGQLAGSSGIIGASGIGASLGGHLNSITITGGTVTAVPTSNAAAIGAGPNGNPAGDPVMECGSITITGGTVTGGIIGFGRTEDAELAGQTTASKLEIGENADLPGCTVRPLPDNCAEYSFSGAVYDTSITSATSAEFSVDGKKRSVQLAVSSDEPYRGDFSATVTMPKKASANAAITWGDKTLSTAGVDLSDTRVSVSFGTQEYRYYSINGTIYDKNITQNMSGSVHFLNRNESVALTYKTPYSAAFSLSKIPLKIADAEKEFPVTITAGDVSWSGTAAAGTETIKTVTIGEQKYKLYSLTGAIYDTKITENMTGTAAFLGQTHPVSLTAVPPYSGTFRITDVPLLIADADAGFSVTVTLNGETWTGTAAAGTDTEKTLVIGTQDYQIYSLSGTIYDARITGDIEAVVTALGSTEAVTLKKQSDYCATFMISSITLPKAQAASGFSVKVAWDGAERTGTAAASSGESKTLVIGKPLQKVRLTLRDSAITRDLDVSSLTVIQNGAALGPDALASGGRIQMNQLGNGYLEIWVPVGTIDLSVTVPELNGGAPIQKSGLAVKEGENTFELYEGNVSSVSAFDLFYGDILFDGSDNNLTVTYSDAEGEHVLPNFSYKDVHVIKQSDAGTVTDHQIKVQNTTQELKIRLDGVNIKRTDGSAPISIEDNCTVELQTGEGTVNQSESTTAPGVYTAPTSTLILSGSGTLKASAGGSAAAIGGPGGPGAIGSGQIIIRSGTVEAVSSGRGAGIGGGGGLQNGNHGAEGKVTISGGTVIAKAGGGGGAAIGGGGGNGPAGGGGTGIVTITGGVIHAECAGAAAAIGSGKGEQKSGGGTIQISGGDITAQSTQGSAIGAGYRAWANVTVRISGGTIHAVGGRDFWGNAMAVIGAPGITQTLTVTVTGGNILAEKNDNRSNSGDALVANPTNGTEAVSLVEITLDGGPAGEDTPVTALEGTGSYGIQDVHPLNGSKLYLYLPAGTLPSKITAGGAEYVPEAEGSENYVCIFSVALDSSYPTEKVYDGKPLEQPTANQLISSSKYDDLTFEWYQGNAKLDTPPVNAGSYVLRVSNGADSKDFPVAITPRPLVGASVAVTGTYTYNGSEQNPAIAVTLGGQTLADTDYTVTCKSVSAGTGTVTVTGTGNYSGSTSAEFTIEQAPVSASSITGSTSKPYDGTMAGPSGLTINLTGVLDGDAVTAMADYTYNSADVDTADTITASNITLSGAAAGNYVLCGTAPTVKGTITKAPAPDAEDGTMDVSNNRENTYSYALDQLLPTLTGGKNFGAVTYELGAVNFTVAGYYDNNAPAAVSADGKTLNLPIQAVASEEKKEIGTVEIIVSSTNFEPMTATITISSVNKAVPVGTATATPSTITYGQAIGSITISGQMMDGTTEVDGSFTWDAPDVVPDAGIYQAAWTFTPATPNKYTVVTGSMAITVRKAAPSLSLTASPATLPGGGTVTLTLTGLPIGGSATVTCSDRSISVTKGTGSTWAAELPAGGGTYTFTATYAGDANYEAAAAGCTVTVRGAVVLPDPPAGDEDTEFRVILEPGISEVPDGLKSIPTLNTPEKLEIALKLAITQSNTGISQANTAVYDVTLMVSRDGGITWEPATRDNFPSDGKLSVTLPYPAGTDSSYRFTVVHMFTTADFGKTPGDTETFVPDQVQNTPQGIRVVVTGLSPISVGWTKASSSSIPAEPSGGDSDNSCVDVPAYAITVEKPGYGTVTSNRTNASSGSTVTLTVTPNKGYVLDALTVTDSQGNEIRLTSKDGGKYTFTMPSRAVTVKAAFAPLPEDVEKPCDGGADCPSHGFTDLGNVGTWYHEAVDFVLRNGLMNGYTSTIFGPNDNLSRAQLAQILYNREGKPAVAVGSTFNDVAPSQWYAPAIAWAAASGIVGGYGDGRFGPDDNITREQLAVMLWRYAGIVSVWR